MAALPAVPRRRRTRTRSVARRRAAQHPMARHRHGHRDHSLIVRIVEGDHGSSTDHPPRSRAASRVTPATGSSYSGRRRRPAPRILRVDERSPIWAPGDVEVDFGAGPVTVRRALGLLNRNDDALRLPVDGPIDWSQLEKLPKLAAIEWTGDDRGMLAAAAVRRVRYLDWSDVAGDVDLSATSLIEVRLAGVGLRSVRLPPSAGRLVLNGSPLPDLRDDRRSCRSRPAAPVRRRERLCAGTADGRRVGVPHRGVSGTVLEAGDPVLARPATARLVRTDPVQQSTSRAVTDAPPPSDTGRRLRRDVPAPAARRRIRDRVLLAASDVRVGDS
jgi:hypothetical protein